MDRRKFLRGSAFISTGLILNPLDLFAQNKIKPNLSTSSAKNIIFMISDGMSSGTLAMANLYNNQLHGKNGNWINLYEENKVKRALMDTASSSSIITDSAAASSAFGGGIRVKNGVLNIGPNGELHVPIWQKFKKAGKRTGCVTTVTITHATPAGFCVNSASRNAEPEIAEKYAEIGIDVLLGGGDEFFNSSKREDKKDLYAVYKKKGYQIAKTKEELVKSKNNQSLLGVFNTGAIPYAIDHKNLEKNKSIPTIAEMTKVAIDNLKGHQNGFVLQIEAGKVDWAAHANDVAGLINDQVAFDETIKTVMDFAEKDGNTLVIITTDHGNANPGTIYGADANKNFESIINYKYTNEHILNEIHDDFNLQEIKDWIVETNGFSLTDDEAKHMLNFYKGLEKEEGLYNFKKLPFKFFSEIQKKHNSVGWISMDHSGDYVELAMYGPGSDLLKPFVKNTDLHQLMLQATNVNA